MVVFLAPGGPNFDPFFTIFCKSILNMPKNIILKNKKNLLSKKVFKSKKLQKWPKKGQKWPFFGPPGPNFAKIKKRLGHFLTFNPERLYTKSQKIWLIRLGDSLGRSKNHAQNLDIKGQNYVCLVIWHINKALDKIILSIDSNV